MGIGGSLFRSGTAVRLLVGVGSCAECLWSSPFGDGGSTPAEKIEE